MAWNGFLPPHNCRNCNQPLSGENGPRPAELYAGSYTGLCYKCQQLDKAIVHTSTLDGALRVTYRAENYSGLGSRVSYVAYPDCPVCNGDGRIKGAYSSSACCYRYSRCQECWARFSAEPHRRAFIDDCQKYQHILWTADNNALARNLELRYGEYLKIVPKAKKLKGKGRSKMFYRDRKQYWKAFFVDPDNLPPEVKLAIDNTTILYYRTYEDRRDALSERMNKKHSIAAADYNIKHPLYSG